MFSLLRPALAGLVLAAFAALAPASEPIADFTLKPINTDKSFTLSENRGKYVALYFLLETECPICIRHTHEHHRGARGVEDLVQVFIKPDDPEATRKWLARLPQEEAEPSVPVIYHDPEGKLAERMGIPDGYQFHGIETHYPALVLIGPEGDELYRYVGRNNMDRLAWPALEGLLARHRAGLPLAEETPTPTPAAESQPAESTDKKAPEAEDKTE